MSVDIAVSDDQIERLPPQSVEAEQAVLGALLVMGDAITRVLDILHPEYFYRKTHQVIYAVMLDLFERNEPIDIVTVSQELKDQGKLETVGGRQFLADLAMSVATTANLEYYAHLVHDKAMLRNLIKAGTEIVTTSYEETDADAAIDKAERLIFSLAENRDLKQLVPIGDIVGDSFAKIEERYTNRDQLAGVPSGFYDLDAMTSGFQKSDLIILAARPSMGKCLSFDSEIVLSDGSIATIEQICKSKSAKLLTLSSTLKLVQTEPSAFIDDGIKPVFKVTTRLGRSVETTLTHPFLTMGGWKKLKDLATGDKIAVPRKIDVFGTGSLSETEVKLLAYQFADENTVRTNPALYTDLQQCLDKDGVTCLGWTVSSNSQLKNAVGAETTSLNVQTAYRRIPSKLFASERQSIALFLNRTFATAGYIVRTAQSPTKIFYCTTNETLVRDIQHLLLRFGVISSIARDVQNWKLTISDRNSVCTFLTDIGIFGQEVKPEALTTVPTSDIYWDEVVSIEPMGKKQVYDLTIPETHNFVANDICVHNTAFVLNIAQHVALEKNLPVAIFSLEMSKEQLVQRMLCSEAGIDATRLRTGNLQNNDWTRLSMAMGRLGEAPMFIDDSAVVTALEIRAKARRLKAEQKDLGMIIIDYIQLMQGRKATDNRVQEVSEISRSLKTLARELEVPVIALSQLSRAVEARQNKRPMLSDLRESGSIEQDADIVMFIYRDEYYNQESDRRGEAEIIIAKQRNGPTGNVDLLFQSTITRFLNKVHNSGYSEV